MLLRKRWFFPLARAEKLVRTLQEYQWDHLVISGDVTNLALEEEFQTASRVLKPLLKDPEKVTIVPGNHDRYVKEVDQYDLFHQYFGAFFVRQTGIKAQPLTEDWHLVGWDSTHPNDWLTASGTVKRETLLATDAYIRNQSDRTRFILVNHYPLWFPAGHVIKPSHELHNLAHVLHWVKQQSRIAVYLHGHVHQNWSYCMRRRDSNRQSRPLYLVNSASSTAKPSHWDSTNSRQSAFHRIHLAGPQIDIEALDF